MSSWSWRYEGEATWRTGYGDVPSATYREDRGLTRGVRAIDVHTHMYLPRYCDIMRNRSALPKIVKDPAGLDKLLILPAEDKDGGAGGRPIDASYWDIKTKLGCMDRSGIDISVISTANPWLDFLDGDAASSLATQLNNDLDAMCDESNGRVYGFGMIPIQDVRLAEAELDRIAASRNLRGIILSTSGRGRGLDDPALDPIWSKLEEHKMTAFIHPHYGIGNEHYDGDRFGHALFLALGFPFETTVAISKMVLAGVLAKHDNLNLLLAHSGGTLPFLAGRLDACAKQEKALMQRLQAPPSVFLKRLNYDAITYEHTALQCSLGFTSSDQLLFGTDHPFSISDAQAQFDSFEGLTSSTQQKIRVGNAARLLNIKAELKTGAASS